MFNHARTLLMNLKGSPQLFADVPGDELIPSSYRKLNLPTYLDVFRSRFFGAMPDRAMLNYRVAQLLTMIEATELQSHILALDSRLTYPSYSTQLAVAETFQPQVNQYEGTSGDRITVLGKAISPDSSGLSGYDYRVRLDGTNISIERLTPPVQSRTELIELTSDLSQVVALPLSGYKVRVNSAGPAAWTLRGYLRPTGSLSSIEEGLRSVGEPYLLQLVGVTDEEPYLTFRNCWNAHPEFAYRIGGLVLAMIYRTEEIRNA
jgi:hypothetical protein